MWAYPVLALVLCLLLGSGISQAARAQLADRRDSVMTRPAEAPAPETGTTSRPRPQPPTGIHIPRLEVSAPVDAVGLNPDGTMEVPTDFSRTGWFSGLEAPGMPGTSVIVGHLDSRKGPAVFHRLRELSPGDEVRVDLADGRTVEFVVERTAKYAKDRFPTIDVYAPSSTAGLRLITCGGPFDRKTRHYRDNVVVYANAKVAA